MSIIFSPRLRPDEDNLERVLRVASEYLLIATVALLPIFFVPVTFSSLGLSKTLFFLTGSLAAAVLFCFCVLRAGVLRIVAPSVLLSLWAFVGIAMLSAVLSGDRIDALWGNVLEVHTATFLAVMALSFSAAVLFLRTKAALVRLFVAFLLVAFALELWHVLRFFFGPEMLSFGFYPNATDTPLGSFNDLAVFAGLVLVVALAALQQLSLRGVSFAFLSVLVLMSLFILAVVNFFFVWLIIGFLSLLILLYALTKDRLLAVETPPPAPSPPTSLLSLLLVGAVFMVSALFIVAGGYLGGALGNTLEVRYLEVRPSLFATLDVMKAVYGDGQALFGVGPNRFADAWRLHKDPSISESLFWNTSFLSGSGYVPTTFVTLGVVGGVALLAFLAGLSYHGGRRLLLPAADEVWYTLCVLSFAAAVYLWVMSFLYVPGPTLLLLATFFSGASVVCGSALSSSSGPTISFLTGRARAFLLIAMVTLIISASVATLLFVGMRYAAHLSYASAVRAAVSGAEPAAVDVLLSRAHSLHAHPLYVTERVRLRLSVLGELLTLSEPTLEETQRFEAVAVEALDLARLAVRFDGSDPVRLGLLGSVYGVLAVAGVAQARELAEESLDRARARDPYNPEYLLLAAQMHARLGDLDRARALLGEALRIKRNYIDALFLLSQIEVREGNAEGAVASARSIISIAPQDPSRHFQLGVLLAATGALTEAITSFETAVALDQNFANARYLLALAYLEEGRREEALTQLFRVRETNRDDQELSALIARIESGESAPPLSDGLSLPLREPPGVVENEGVTTSTARPDTDLVVPVNRPASSPGTSAGAGSATGTAPVDDDTEGSMESEEVAR